MEIIRHFYLGKLIKRKNNSLIKVITGIRRCGKSYLLNNLFVHYLLDNNVPADHIIRFAFDSAETSKRLAIVPLRWKKKNEERILRNS